MFGYVIPRRDKLSESQQARYKGAYCGLCRALKLRYGFRARFLVNYDLTFLYFLMQKQKEQKMERCFCPANPFCKKDCLPADEAMEYAADLCILLSCQKLEDAALDGGLFTKIGAKLGLLFYRRAYRKAAAFRPTEDLAFRTCLQKLHTLERERCGSIDRVADAFATLLKVGAASIPDEARRRPMEHLLYHVGRYLYLTDALEDLPKDLKKDNYNPLRYRYSLGNGCLRPEDKRQLMDTIDASISMAASAFELLESGENTEILDNIIYYGLPAVLHSVAQGTFRKRGKKHERSL